ncbi:hypothetical protein VNI00_007738 [Paramarasmius palmivorus]|uniref:Uncharacterized protein n=1 Tax=Paramarasmius palmivorus TaxID=297713 RepID=A0AAW0D4B9_9AGAR
MVSLSALATQNVINGFPYSSLASYEMLRDSYATSTRQTAFVETVSQRRARVDFLAHNQRRGDQRVESWVKEQASVATTSIMPPTTTAAAKSRGHRRNRFSLISSNQIQPLGVGQAHSPSRKPLHYHPAAHITPIPEDEEPYIVYSTPLIVQPSAMTRTQPPINEPYVLYSTPSLSTATPRQTHLPDLVSIPEE